MLTRMRVLAALGAVLAAVVVVVLQGPATAPDSPAVALRGTGAPLPLATTTIKWPVLETTDPSPFDPCSDIPIDVINSLGLGVTPPEVETINRCHYDGGNYQVAVESVIWRSFEQTLPADAIELDIAGHRAAQYWVMKPTDWNNRWWITCMVAFKTSYGLIQQSLFYSPIYSNPDVDCFAENLRRANELAPHYIY
ncbi:DUF3558 domain-containing protein [soil metagenome]|jgi:hypothetical protein